MANTKTRRYEISDANYERIQHLLSGKPGDPGRNADDNRAFINGVLLGRPHGSALRGPAGAVWQVEHGVPALQPVGKERTLAGDLRSLARPGPRMAHA